MPETPSQTPHEHSDHVSFLEDAPLNDATETISSVPVLPQLSVALGLLVFVFAVTYIGATNSISKKSLVTEEESHEVHEFVTKIEEREPLPTIFSDVSLRAKSAIVWDVSEQRVLFNKNADDQLPLASITKLMTALVAYELLGGDETVAITQSSLKTEGDSGFVDGEEFTVQNLSDLTLISSSNDGASALSATAGSVILETANPEYAFVHAMNLKAEELGLTKTYFKNSTGLDLSESEAGAYGSARDIALLMEYIIKESTDPVALTNLDITTIRNERGQYHTAKNTNEVVNDIDGLIASKTGYTDLSGGNLVVAVNIGLNHPVIVAVLGSSQEGRFSDTLALIAQARLSVATRDK